MSVSFVLLVGRFIIEFSAAVAFIQIFCASSGVVIVSSTLCASHELVLVRFLKNLSIRHFIISKTTKGEVVSVLE